MTSKTIKAFCVGANKFSANDYGVVVKFQFDDRSTQTVIIPMPQAHHLSGQLQAAKNLQAPANSNPDALADAIKAFEMSLTQDEIATLPANSVVYLLSLIWNADSSFEISFGDKQQKTFLTVSCHYDFAVWLDDYLHAVYGQLAKINEKSGTVH